MRRIIIPLIFGLSGAAILIALGVWQMQRLAWKEGVLSEIEARIGAETVALPAVPDPEADKYLPVLLDGEFGESSLRVLVSKKKVGAGYRVISPFVVAGRTILVDRGFIRVDTQVPDAPAGPLQVTGNLHWPDDRSNATPENDIEGNIWFARDVELMSGVLGTEPFLVVAREMSVSDAPVTPLPVDTAGIPNDHLQYAITWFSLAAIWLAMTGYFLVRTTRAAKG